MNWKTVEDYTPPANTDLLVTVAGKSMYGLLGTLHPTPLKLVKIT